MRACMCVRNIFRICGSFPLKSINKQTNKTKKKKKPKTYTTLRALVCPPRSIELKDLKGDMHHLDVKVLGTEETWNTPSLLLANNKKSGGTAVFSQVSKYPLNNKH